MSDDNPTVFISYAHEGDLGERVRDLAAWLTEQGVRTVTDHPFQNRPPEEGWRAWMQHNIEDADLTLIVCSERYRRLFEKREVDDAGGRGVTWESAIITSDLYGSRLNSRRFFPVLPDDGEQDHVPALLQDWNNNHRFPSGNERILSLIRDEVTQPVPDKSFPRLLPGELNGSDDPRLLPREGEVLGREEEVGEVLDFLNGGRASAAVSGHVTGSAGIGKTEVCKAALRRWLRDGRSTRAFYVQLSDDADASQLLVQMGEAIGLSPEVIAQSQHIAQLRRHLPEALYYLDNVENLAESADGISLLRELSNSPGLRLLASSRVALDAALGESITVGRLDPESARDLFLRIWNGTEKLDVSAVKRFVDQELGGHALSITLLARLGRAYGWQTVLEKWQLQGTQLARARKASDRMDSLDASFAITRDLLSKEPGSLDLWVFAALFPEGIESELLELWGDVSGFPQARVALADHHLLIRTERADRFSVLPPVARYALGQALGEQETTTGFSWESARDSAYACFIELSRLASEVVSSPESIKSRTKSAQNLAPIGQLIGSDAHSGTPSLDSVRRLHRQLQAAYAYNALDSRTTLLLIQRLLKDGLSKERLGQLASRLGEVNEARRHYDEAIVLFKQEQNRLGQANTLLSLGDLLRRLGKISKARHHYDEAMALFKQEQDRLGQANTLQSLGELAKRLGKVDEARGHYDEAMALFKQEQNRLGQANTLQMLGELAKRLGEIDEARVHLNDAMALYEQDQNRLGQARTHGALGDLAMRLGELKGARGHYDEAMALSKQEQDGLGQANILQSLGELAYRLGKDNEARVHYDEAIALYKQEQNRLGQANTLQSLGELASQLGNVDEARGHYDEAMALFKQEQNRLGQANTLQSLGDLASKLGNVDEAREHYAEAKVLFEQEQNRLGQANTLQGLGDALLAANEPAQALPLYFDALKLYRFEQLPMGQAYVLAEILRCRSLLGDLDEDQLVETAAAALAQAAASGVDLVTKYVLAALREICGEDEEKLAALLEKVPTEQGD